MKKIAAVALVTLSLTACSFQQQPEAQQPTKAAQKEVKASEQPKEAVKVIEAPVVEEVVEAPVTVVEEVPVAQTPVNIPETPVTPIEAAPEVVAPVQQPVAPVQQSVAPVAPPVESGPVPEIETTSPEAAGWWQTPDGQWTNAPRETETADYVDHSTHWATAQLAAWGLTGATVVVSDTTAICGVRGGCSPVGSGIIYLDPTLPNDMSSQHVLAHEYGHAVMGFQGWAFTMEAECGAEAFARSVTGVDHFSYPKECAAMVRNLGK